MITIQAYIALSLKMNVYEKHPPSRPHKDRYGIYELGRQYGKSVWLFQYWYDNKPDLLPFLGRYVYRWDDDVMRKWMTRGCRKCFHKHTAGPPPWGILPYKGLKYVRT